MNDTYLKHVKAITVLVVGIAVLAFIATLLGIFSKGGPGLHEYLSQHGQSVTIYGHGLYQWMPADVAIQGIAQDYVTLILAIPLLLVSFWKARKGSMQATYVLAGTSGYFFVTYLFYLTMASYSVLFLVHAALLSMSFFTLFLTISNLLYIRDKSLFPSKKQMKWAGGFLLLNSIMVAILWLGVILPPLLDGSIYPPELFHLTTLIVQGLDLGLLLPIGIVIGILTWKGQTSVYPFLVVYLVFLTQLMVALSSKIFFMGLHGQSIIPVVFIIPTICIISGIFSVRILMNIKKRTK